MIATFQNLFEKVKDFIQQDWWSSHIEEYCEECGEDPCSCEIEEDKNGRDN